MAATPVRQFLLNVPVDLAAAVEDEAAREGVSFTYVFKVAVARYFGLPEPARPVRRARVEHGTRVPVWRDVLDYLADEWKPATAVALAWKGTADRRAVNSTRWALREAVERGAAESLGDGRGGQGHPTLYRRSAQSA
ncbi:MAG TPA: hypothetical protein VFJ77_05605 [Gaiellaceae bacterium]|nr:hypothetical protein [Gaiellaceae bacterium]